MAGVKDRHVLLAGGGSGGHVFPGLAVAAELVRRGLEVSWVGSARGMEARLVPERDLDFYELPARPVLGQGVLGKLRAGVTLTGAALKARRLVRDLGARLVVGTGGYVSAPAVLGARLAARPVFLIEPNADSGFANRWLSRFAAEAAVAYDETAATLHCPATTTGIPIRSEFFDVPEELPPSPPLRLLVLGGSQGSRELNEMVPKVLSSLDAGELAVVHQCGATHVEKTREAYSSSSSSSLDVEVVPFLDDVAGAMARSHLVLSRAGAITLAEVCAAGRPTLLVPLRIAAAHQVSNARRLAEAGAAEMLGSGGEKELRALLAGILGGRERLAAMARAARGLARRDAAAAIADRVETLCGKAAGTVPLEGSRGGNT